jgi:hypothetical protein
LVGGAAAVIGGGIGGKAVWKGWSWIRDNVLDQHGCYIQYLNRNGQAMDAGLNQSGQGMVVGRYSTKKLLPGILGVSQQIRTPEGYMYIRTDDLLKSLGWREKEINDLTRYISLENAMVNSQVLKYSGIGPEKAGLNRFFKVICKVSHVVDGDTIDVIDIFDKAQVPFRVRFDGINTPELSIVKSNTSTLPPKTVNVKSIRINNNIMFIKFDLTLKEFSDLVDSPSNYFQTDDKIRISIPDFNGSQLLLDGTIAVNGKEDETIKDTTTITPSFTNGIQRFRLSSDPTNSGFYVGSRVKVYNKNSPEVNWMEGVITEIDNTQNSLNPESNNYGIFVNVDTKSGTTASAVYSISDRLFLNGFITIPYQHANVAEKNYTGNVTVYSYKSTEFKLNTSPGGASTLFTQNAIKDKLIVLRVNPDTKKMTAIVGEDDFEAGAQKNNYISYGKDIYGTRVLGTIFYKTTSSIIDALRLQINNLFIKSKLLSDRDILKDQTDKESPLRSSFHDGVFHDRFTEIYNSISETSLVDYYKLYAASNPNLVNTTSERKKIYNTYFTMRIIRDIYEKVSDWPNIAWDEYYEDGTPASLNWELVVNNLAKVYTSGLLVEQPSINTSSETAAMGKRIIKNE